MSKYIFVTGGAGYIGSHTCIELISAGYQPVVFDNLCNSSLESLKRVERITGQSVPFHHGDIRDSAAIENVLGEYDFYACIHFAGLKAVGESVEKPFLYFDNNITGSQVLFETMQKSGLKKVIFSSSATVYGEPNAVPITESAPAVSATNPYGRSKLYVEGILNDIHTADKQWSIALLRYFNPVGAHHSGLIGEDPKGLPNNLMPYVSGVAVGRYPELAVFGDDYPTHDGTGVRDYIHVVDLAKGHVKALDYFVNNEQSSKDAAAPFITVNLGTGVGYSVLDMVNAFEKASGKSVKYAIKPRRAGDIACCFADPSTAKQLLGWVAQCDVEQMCEDTWRWQSNNPSGYDAIDDNNKNDAVKSTQSLESV